MSSRPLPDVFADDARFDLVIARDVQRKEFKNKAPDKLMSEVVPRDEGARSRTQLRLPPDAHLAYPTSPFSRTTWREGRCALLVDVTFSDDRAARKGLPASFTPYVTSLSGGLRSPGCGFAFELNATTTRVDWELATNAASWYSTVLTLVCLGQILALFKQLHHCRVPAVAQRVSLASIAMQSLLDAVVCVGNLLMRVSQRTHARVSLPPSRVLRFWGVRGGR